MIKQLLLLLCIVQLASCSNSQVMGTVKGTLTSSEGEPLPFIKVTIKDLKLSAVSDIEGNYMIRYIPEGTHLIVFESVEIGEPVEDQIEVRNEQTTVFNRVFRLETRDVMLKPIIYLYPEDTTEISVTLDYKGTLTTTYPKLKDSWNVTAYPDGTLLDANGRSYYSLYWEGIPTNPLVINEGHVVSKDETISFLEENLAILGLNEREANEFIIFWLPMLEESAYNVIEFSTEEYEQQAGLTIVPKPDQTIRVMMLYHGLKSPIELPKQDIQALKRERSGFTVVEWGGQHAKVMPEN